MLYGGAALPGSVWERLNRIATVELGRRVHITAGYGSTETAPGLTLVHFETSHAGVLGLPIPGVVLMMVPVPGTDKYELRAKGPNVTPGYWRRDDLTAAAFDEDGYYRMGDAGRFVDPADATRGIAFAGRLAEDFKLTNGTWVHTGELRLKAIAALAPLAQDVVVAGHDRDDIRFLIVPNVAGCRGLCPDLPGETSLNELLSDARVWERVRDGLEQLKSEGSGISTYATRALFLIDPPSIDKSEITDKGYINQNVLLENRGDMVERLYTDEG